MSGSKVGSMSRHDVLAAVKAVPKSQDFVWDGVDEDDRPLTREEMQEGIIEQHKKMGRPSGSHKTATTIRFDDEVIEAFKATGKGWQTRMNAALKEWLKSHSPGR